MRILLRGVLSLPLPILGATGAASAAVVAFGLVSAWPLWALVIAGGAPWVPLLFLETTWMYRHYHWLAFFWILVVTQSGHMLEHLVQMVQIHVLQWPLAHSRGVFGELDVEWVHFGWNTYVLAATVALIARYPSNRWLWATLALAGWHELEHIYIMSVYLQTGVAGTPGLLSTGGALWGGLPMTRPDLHFLYNVVETAPLLVAFVSQLRYTYDAWLAKAFPRLEEPELVSLTRRAQPQRVRAGDDIIREGEQAGSLYVLTRGTAEVLRKGKLVAELNPGSVFGEIALQRNIPRTATVRARTPIEMLELDKVTAQALLERSSEEESALTRPQVR